MHIGDQQVFYKIIHLVDPIIRLSSRVKIMQQFPPLSSPNYYIVTNENENTTAYFSQSFSETYFKKYSNVWSNH
jgi:hypothetical protein